ncbi:hypothetical protein [Candidatus Kuenenia stuttgartiensis]|uniref:hypothetical protein n=3 Tax=Candidatus Brocadiaceae TaxID=1127830 RepID=UPI0013ED970F|nr:hypothetical protein [Candidatus Kuenenia stuttgartiensis]
MVIRLWLYGYGYTAMVIRLWLYGYGYTAMVIRLWLYGYGYTAMVIRLWLYGYGYTAARSAAVYSTELSLSAFDLFECTQILRFGQITVAKANTNFTLRLGKFTLRTYLYRNHLQITRLNSNQHVCCKGKTQRLSYHSEQSELSRMGIAQRKTSNAKECVMFFPVPALSRGNAGSDALYLE